MDVLRVAAPLSRLLLALSETGREGALVVEQRGQRARLSIARGRLVDLSGVELPPLGDALLALGALDVARQRCVLTQPSSTPVGARLVAAGATSSAAVLRALELQLSHGLYALLRWPSTRLTLEPELRAHRSGVATLDLTCAVWSSLFALARTLPEATVEQLAGCECLQLSHTGTRRVRGLLHAHASGALEVSLRRLGPGDGELEPARLARLLCEGALAHVLSAAPQPDALWLRAILRVLGLAKPRATSGEHANAYALLLRKTRELSRNASANVLLDLPAQASPAHARRALRKLAHKLHPDRFHAGDSRLYALSHRVMGALAQAESALRPPTSA